MTLLCPTDLPGVSVPFLLALQLPADMAAVAITAWERRKPGEESCLERWPVVIERRG